MIIFSYDIWDGDKGLIIAESYDQAVEIFKKDYPKVEVVEEEFDRDTCRIDVVSELEKEPALYFLYN